MANRSEAPDIYRNSPVVWPPGGAWNFLDDPPKSIAAAVDFLQINPDI